MKPVYIIIFLFVNFFSFNIFSQTIAVVNVQSLIDNNEIYQKTLKDIEINQEKFLINNNYITINEKKLLFINIQGKNLKRSTELQDSNIKSLSNFIYKVFNQIKIIDSLKDEDDNFIHNKDYVNKVVNDLMTDLKGIKLDFSNEKLKQSA